MSPASAGSPKGRDAVGGSIAGGDNIAVGVADAPDTSQEEAVEVRARELLAVQLDKDGFTLAADCVRDGYTIGAVSSTALRAIIAALSPNMDHAVGGEERSAASLMLQAMLLDTPDYEGDDARSRYYRDRRAKLSVAIAALSAPQQPVKLDAVREALKPFAEAARNAEISGRPPFEFVSAGDFERALALATPPLDNTGLDAVREALELARAELVRRNYPWTSEKTDAAIARVDAALATPSTDTGLDPATVERCALVADEEMENRRAEQKRDLLCNYLRGQINAAIRIGDQIRALASGDRS